jgi:hypothetical protein
MTFASSSSLVAAAKSPQMEEAGYPVNKSHGTFLMTLKDGDSYGDQSRTGIAKMGKTYLFRLADSDETVFHFPKKNPRQARDADREVNAAEILNGWVKNHLSNPYPTAAEKASLMAQTGLKPTQLKNWFDKFRGKRKAAAQSDRGPKQMKLSFTKAR